MITPDEPPGSESVARHYDDLDVFYRDIWGEHVHHGLWERGGEIPKRRAAISSVEAAEQLVHLIAERAGIESGTRVCDVGCGYGATARLLAAQYHALVTGLTVSQAQYRYAVLRNGDDDNPRFLLGCWEHNAFVPESFDVVVSIECFSHVADKIGFFREIQRVLRPGGRAVIAVWLASPGSSRWAVRHLLKPICREGRLAGLATADECRKTIAEAGLCIEQFDDLSRAVRQTWWICARRLCWKVFTQRRYLHALFDRRNSNRVFAITLFRILAAYQTGAMRYGLFQIQKPTGGTRADVGGSGMAILDPTSSIPRDLRDRSP